TFVDKSPNCQSRSCTHSTGSTGYATDDQEQNPTGSQKDLVDEEEEEYLEEEDDCHEPADDGSKVTQSKSLWDIFYRLHRIDWRREREYFRQPDQLFPYYLVASMAISVAIIAIRYLT